MDQSPDFIMDIESFADVPIDLDQFILTDYVTTFDIDFPLNITLPEEPFQEISTMDDTATAADFAVIPTGVGEFNLVGLPESPLITTSPEQSPEVIELIRGDFHQSTPILFEELDLTVKTKRLKKNQRNPGGGSNPYGRKGTRRCEVCRSWRRKVQPPIYPTDFYLVRLRLFQS
jgi:hypothetical protein